MSFPLAVPGGASHLLSAAAQRDAETDVSVRAERARLAGNEWEFDYAALHSRANTIKKPAKQGCEEGGPSLPLSPYSWRLSFPSSPSPCPAGTEGLHTLFPGTPQNPITHPDMNAEGREDGRDHPPRAPQDTYLPLPSWPCQLCPACACAGAQAPLLFTLQSSPPPLSGLYLAPRHRTACEMH